MNILCKSGKGMRYRISCTLNTTHCQIGHPCCQFGHPCCQFNSFKLIDFLIILELKGHGFYFFYHFFSCGTISKYFRGGEPKYIYLRANLNFCGSIPVFFFFFLIWGGDCRSVPVDPNVLVHANSQYKKTFKLINKTK